MLFEVKNTPIKFFISFCFLFFFSHSFAQQQLFLPLQRDINLDVERYIVKSDSNFHTSIRPFLNSELAYWHPIDSVYNDIHLPKEPTKQDGFIAQVWYNILHDHLITVNEDILHLTIDPVIDFSYGKYASGDSSTYMNTRGIMVAGDIGKKVSFMTLIEENQAEFPSYLTQFILDTSVVPGQSRAKNYEKTKGFDFPLTAGYISYTPSKYFNLYFGNGKHFFGDGYRSLLLSDNSTNYPAFALTLNVWHFKYTNLYTVFSTPNDSLGSANLGKGYPEKFASFHYLSTTIGKDAEWGLFEGVIYHPRDSSALFGFDLNYLNPVIFYHTVQLDLGSPDNSIIGTNFRLNVAHAASLYGQLLIDDWDFSKSKGQSGFYSDKYAFQLGVKYYDVFGVPNLFFQTEYNQVWPYTYAHKLPELNYTNGKQALADPLGANFRESISFLHYRYKRWQFEFENLYALIGADTGSSANGENLFSSDYNIPNFPNSYGNYVTQGVKTTLMLQQLRADFIINTKNYMMIEGVFMHRTETSSIQKSSLTWISAGLKMNLFNKYYDF
jgi:hypothetical protein